MKKVCSTREYWKTYMKLEDSDMCLKFRLDNIEITWCCRFHPIDWFHEVGCPHCDWTKEQLQEALISAKKTIAYHFEIFKKHPELLAELYKK